jgi:PIN domain nuclease of toxin-antitoxin system
VRLLLDTVVFIFAVQAPERLSRKASEALTNPDNVRYLSSVSLTEISIKAALNKLNFSAELAREALDDLDVRILPFTAEHAFRLFDLATHHNDPFDRQIIAQALAEDIPVATPDRKFSAYRDLQVIW